MTIKDRIQNKLEKQYAKNWRIFILSVGRRRSVGKYYEYNYEYAMYPKKGWLGGYTDGIFRILKNKINK